MKHHIQILAPVIAGSLLLTSCGLWKTKATDAKLQVNGVANAIYDSLLDHPLSIMHATTNVDEIQVSLISAIIAKHRLDQINLSRSRANHSLLPTADPWGNEWRLAILKSESKDQRQLWRLVTYSIGPNNKDEFSCGDDISSLPLAVTEEVFSEEYELKMRPGINRDSK